VARERSGGHLNRWIHKDVARRYGADEDAVRRIYAAVQTAKRQGFHGGYYADFVERSLGRKLAGAEYTISKLAKQRLNYDPPGGYGGPKPSGVAAEPSRDRDRQKMEQAERMASGANKIIRDVSKRRERFEWSPLDWTARAAYASLKDAADVLDVAADLYEEAGAMISAGTLRKRATYARKHNFEMLAIYE
jgi:hypothetical protein